MRLGPCRCFPGALAIELGHREPALVSALVHSRASLVWPRAHSTWAVGQEPHSCSAALSCPAVCVGLSIESQQVGSEFFSAVTPD